MKPTDLIKHALGEDGWQLACSAWAESSVIEVDETLWVFPSFKIYRVKGATGQFEFPMLPHCSYGYFAANGREAFQLTRRNKEIERLLKTDWQSLPSLPVNSVAERVLPFYDGGIKASHRVLSKVSDLERMCDAGHFELDRDQFAQLETANIETCLTLLPDVLQLTVLTLQGWMHTKSNLGIETLSIHADGTVSMAERKVLSERIFRSVPAIMY